jgi:formate hydrogenlyase subunit 6/NADH:ubiquinone oxidoreductase subunit I
MDTLFLRNEDIFKFYERIAEDYELYVPVKSASPFKVKCEYGFNLPSDDYSLKRYSEEAPETAAFNDYRAIEPIRTFFTHFKEDICGYFSDTVKAEKPRPVAICGVKNCDIFALKIQDYVFLQGVDADPLYRERRDEGLIIASDCTAFKESCFCRSFDINPYAVTGFDLNLTPTGNGYLVDIATSKGNKAIEGIRKLFVPATFGQISGRSAKRETVVKRIEEHLGHHKIPKKESLRDIVVSGFNSGIWQEQMKTCVECGGCIFICDTCHCFLLSDEPAEGGAKKVRSWDGCLLKNFSRVAGGANPLRMRYMRLRNRYLKKFDFFIQNLGYQACCGCGRCVDVCPGKIDIRHILRKLNEEKSVSAG